MKKYYVQIPIAGHLSFEVEAECKEQAIELAFELDSSAGELSYDELSSFNSGNVCHCPSPWKATATEY